MAIDWVLMMALPLVATAAAWIFNLNFLSTTLLYFGVPALYLSLRKPKLVKKTLMFCVMFAVPLWVIFDHLSYLDRSWFVPNSALRLLRNSLPIETLVWSFTWMYFVIIWWEFFVDKSKNRAKFSKKMKYLVAFVTVLLIMFGMLYLIRPALLHIPYFYVNLGIFFISVPIVVALVHTRRLVWKFWPLGIYFLLVAGLTEWVGLTHNHWVFGGTNYLGGLKLWGSFLPIDEIIFWLLLGAPGLISWYEMFADDWK